MATCVHSQPEAPKIEPEECTWFSTILTQAQMDRLECAWLVVPEFRDERESSYNMELALLRIRSRQATDSAPILYLPGGPGEAASSSLTDWMESDLSQAHDIIILDPRGTGFSYPSLICPEASQSKVVDWVSVCRERISARGLDLTAYTIPVIVRDYVDLLSLMDLPQVNVYGSSYGSRLALMLADAAPERIRSLALDGVYPPPLRHTAEVARNLDMALNRLFDDCAKDVACKEAYPELRDAFYRAGAELNASPQELSLLGQKTGMTITGNDFVLMTSSLLQHASAIPYLPGFIASIASGHYDLELLLESELFASDEDDRGSQTESAYLTQRCSEDLAVPEAERYLTDPDGIAPLLIAAARQVVEAHYADCQAWNVPALTSRLESPVTSGIPSLLMSGAYDPATSAQWGSFAAEHLQNNWHFVFPNAGHGMLDSVPCATEIMGAFLSDPLQDPSADCFSALRPPRFVIWRGKSE
ncbi:MAG: alpha/beta fold hydrolase [Chloroflexi bacterium]|nr:alpha/beta fold hydrolase [Chloroflexota bacterium]